MKKRIAQPRIGKDGKYLSLFIKHKYSWSSSTAKGMEKGLREHLRNRASSISKTISAYENYALEILESVGFRYKKPYNYFDRYVVNGSEYSYFSGKEYKTCKEQADAQNSMPWGILTGVVKIILNDPDSDMTVAGRAAEILHSCHVLKESMVKGDIENTAHRSMLLQQEIDILSFMVFEEWSRIGEKRQGSGKKVGTANRGTERAFTTIVREAISKSPPDCSVDDIIHKLENLDIDIYEFDSNNQGVFSYWIADKQKTIKIEKLKQKISKLKKT